MFVSFTKWVVIVNLLRRISCNLQGLLASLNLFDLIRASFSYHTLCEYCLIYCIVFHPLYLFTVTRQRKWKCTSENVEFIPLIFVFCVNLHVFLNSFYLAFSPVHISCECWRHNSVSLQIFHMSWASSELFIANVTSKFVSHSREVWDGLYC